MYCPRESKYFECPFTWNVSRELCQQFDEDKELQTAASDQQVISLMNSVTAIYCSVMKHNYECAKRKITEAESLYKNLDALQLKVERVSIAVLKHIVDSTKYHAYRSAGDGPNATIALSRLVDSRELSSQMELATIHGCRALVYSSFHEAARFEALDDARLAISYLDNCPLWYLVLYKSLRHKRRKAAKFGSTPPPAPCDEEKAAILHCVDLSEKPFYLVHAAQMQREDKNLLRASIMYRRALKANPQSMGILLRLAIGFIKCGQQMELARNCLDIVQMNSPDNTMFLHYKAIYFEELGEYKQAAAYYKAASRNNNFPADILYAVSLRRAGEPFDCVHYLRQLLNKYTDVERTQQIWLHLALQYYQKAVFDEACRCFITAIEIDRTSQYLKKFKNSLVNGKFINILDLINTDLIFNCPDEDMAIRLQELCG